MINFFLFFTWDSEISAHWLSWVWNGVGENTWLSLEVILTKGFTSKALIDALRCDGGTTLRQEAQRLAGGIFLQNSYLLIGIWSNWTNWHKVLVWCLVHIWTCSLPLSGVRTLIWLLYGANCMSGAQWAMLTAQRLYLLPLKIPVPEAPDVQPGVFLCQGISVVPINCLLPPASHSLGLSSGGGLHAPLILLLLSFTTHLSLLWYWIHCEL